MSRVSLPATMLVIAVLAAIYFLVTFMPSRAGHQQASRTQPEPETVVPADCKANMCYEVRSSGPKIVTRGDITLHIPITSATRGVTPPKEIDLTPVSVCFPGPGDPPPCDAGIPTFGFWLREGALEPTFTETPDEWLSRVTESYNGPIEGPVDGVSAYLGKSGRIFVLDEKDARGRFVIARCYTECRVHNSVLPGLFADYRFPPAFISQWPDLDRAIRHYFETVQVAPVPAD